MDFKYTVTEVQGTWNGLVKHLHEEKAVFGWAHFFITRDRRKLIDFTQYFDADKYCFFVRKLGIFNLSIFVCVLCLVDFLLN
jgi:hypothetical protein